MSNRSKSGDSGSVNAGWRCISVAPDADGQYEFSYTSGVWRAFRHPEISIFGLPSAVASKVLDSVVSRVRDGVRLEDLDTVGDVLQGGFTLKVGGFASRHSYDEYFGEGMRQLGEDVPVLVLLWPNRKGEFPRRDEVHPQVEAFRVMDGG